MKMKEVISVCIFAFVVVSLVLCGPASALAVSTVTISPGKDGVFLLRGIGVEDACALDITILYDADTRAELRVVEGPLISGAMTAINTKVPGTVRIVIVRVAPIKGSGVIATLIFDRNAAPPGKISTLKASLADTKGAAIPVRVQVDKAPNVSAKTPAASQSNEAPPEANRPR